MTTGNAPGAAAADIGANGTGMDADACSAAHAVPSSTLHLVRPNPANAVPVAMEANCFLNNPRNVQVFIFKVYSLSDFLGRSSGA